MTTARIAVGLPGPFFLIRVKEPSDRYGAWNVPIPGIDGWPAVGTNGDPTTCVVNKIRPDPVCATTLVGVGSMKNSQGLTVTDPLAPVVMLR
jgi:hypothetical protein